MPTERELPCPDESEASPEPLQPRFRAFFPSATPRDVFNTLLTEKTFQVLYKNGIIFDPPLHSIYYFAHIADDVVVIRAGNRNTTHWTYTLRFFKRDDGTYLAGFLEDESPHIGSLDYLDPRIIDRDIQQTVMDTSGQFIR